MEVGRDIVDLPRLGNRGEKRIHVGKDEMLRRV